jgi:MYXO-CTERM domain-containing protein
MASSIPDSVDLCQYFASDNNDDTDGDLLGDACDPDLDEDGVPNVTDNCMFQSNASQLNGDRDGFGDACDSTFCFVVDDATQGRCLNPASRFHGRPGPDVVIQVGEELRLRVFTNRPNAPTRYAWKVAQAPEGSAFEISHPTGMVNYSTPWEFHYEQGRAANFVAKAPGEYQVELQTQLLFADDLYPDLNSDKQVMKVKVEGEAAGCAATSTGHSLAALMLLAGLTLAWRRRR